MDKDTIIKELADLFREFFDDPDLEPDPESSPDTIEDWDSLAHISLIASIEKNFLVKFSMKQVSELKTFGKLASALETMLRK